MFFHLFIKPFGNFFPVVFKVTSAVFIHISLKHFRTLNYNFLFSLCSWWNCMGEGYGLCCVTFVHPMLSPCHTLYYFRFLTLHVHSVPDIYIPWVDWYIRIKHPNSLLLLNLIRLRGNKGNQLSLNLYRWLNVIQEKSRCQIIFIVSAEPIFICGIQKYLRLIAVRNVQF